MLRRQVLQAAAIGAVPLLARAQESGDIVVAHIGPFTVLPAPDAKELHEGAQAAFADINVGEDNAFVWAPQQKRIAINPDQHLYVARVHARNTSPKETLNRRWRRWCDRAARRPGG